MFLKTRAYEKSYDGEIKRLNVLIKEAELFKKHANIWIKICNSIKKTLFRAHQH